ncbi:hypothetical protein RvY_08603 [Ramazzottius varieornatus]|uniref:Uncharacterized protein n=1 Tax=Ramazzottius varieornatus TaxID=947166 RepID=A0A1D1VC11_RAMVA|nr:hypothetical protein RvY_08603 [Ramazzottius varieornatus]
MHGEEREKKSGNVCETAAQAFGKLRNVHLRNPYAMTDQCGSYHTEPLLPRNIVIIPFTRVFTLFLK